MPAGGRSRNVIPVRAPGLPAQSFRGEAGGPSTPPPGDLPAVEHLVPEVPEPQGGVVRAAVRGLPHPGLHHLPHEDGVVAPLHRRHHAAFDEGGRIDQDGRAGGAGAIGLARDGRSLAFRGLEERERHGLLALAEHVEREGVVPFPSAEAWRKLLAEQQPGGKILLATIDGRVVGQIGIHTVARPRRSHVGYIGMAVHDEWHHQGVGSALLQAAISLADNWLHLLRLELTVYTDNEVAVRLYKKYGFLIEGTHRAYALRDGKYVDAYAMARIHPNPPNIASRRPARKRRAASGGR